MKKQEDNFDPDESFDEAMSPENIANSSGSDSEDAEPLAKVSKVHKLAHPPSESVQKMKISEMKEFLKYLKDYQFTSEDCYRKYLDTHPEIQVSWQVLYKRVAGMQHQYELTKKWLHENVADIDESEIEKELKLRCPFYYELDEVFREKSHHAKMPEVEVSKAQRADDSVIENRTRVAQFPESFPTRMDDIAAKRLQFERRKLHFENIMFERDSSMAREKFTFECDMKRREIELRNYEIDTERMHIENMMEVQKLRLQNEEKLKMYRIEMESGTKVEED